MKRDGQMGLFHAVNVEGIERPVHVYGTLKRKCKGLRIFPQAFCMAKQWNASLFMRNARNKEAKEQAAGQCGILAGLFVFPPFPKTRDGRKTAQNC